MELNKHDVIRIRASALKAFQDSGLKTRAFKGSMHGDDFNEAERRFIQLFADAMDSLNTHTLTGIELIAQERQKQIDKYGFTGEHHVAHPVWYEEGQLISAAHMISAYDPDRSPEDLYRQMVPLSWDKEWWQRMCDKPKFDRLIIAGALIAAEIDRLQATDKTEQP